MTGLRGAHGVRLSWALSVERQDWTGLDQIELWVFSQKGSAIDIGNEGGMAYSRGLKFRVRDGGGTWFGPCGVDVPPYMGGVWQIIRLPLNAFRPVNNKKPDWKRITALEIDAYSTMQHDLEFLLSDVGLKHMDVNGPSTMIQARDTGYLTEPGGDFSVQLVSRGVATGQTAVAAFVVRDFWGKEIFHKDIAISGDVQSQENVLKVPIRSSGYFDLSVELSAAGKPLWRASRGLASLPPLSAEQIAAKQASPFSIWTSYHEALGGDWVRKFLVLPKTGAEITSGAWTPPRPPPGTKGICCIVPPAFWNGQWFNPSSTPAQYDEFAKDLEASVRLMADGRFPYYETINEPNAKYFGPIEKLVDYHRLVYQAIKRADPKAKVGGPCPYGIHVDYIEKFLAAGGEKCIDFIAVHGYAPEDTFRKQLRDLKAMLAGRGLADREILITEKGDPIPTVTPEQQARILVRAYVIAMSEGVRLMTWHAYMGMIEKPGDRGIKNSCSDFNMLRADGSANPSFVSYGIMTRVLLGARYVKPVEGLPASCEGYDFARGGTRILVLWKTRPGREEVALPAGRQTYYLDMMGVRHNLVASDAGHATLTVAEDPIYIMLPSARP